MENIYSMVHSAQTQGASIYYKLICIDEQHAIIAEQQLNNAETDKLKAKRLGRAVIVSISKEGLDQNELLNSAEAQTAKAVNLSEINYLLSSVRVHAMAYDDELSQYDINEIDKI